jgi:hypothetical protein
LHGVVVKVAVKKAAAKLPRCKVAPSVRQALRKEKRKSKERAAA